jgi:hypothetical protein
MVKPTAKEGKVLRVFSSLAVGWLMRFSYTIPSSGSFSVASCNTSLAGGSHGIKKQGKGMLDLLLNGG